MRPVWLCILGLSWFWAIGATLLSEFPSVAKDALGADGHVVTLLPDHVRDRDRCRLDVVCPAVARGGQCAVRAVRGVGNHSVYLDFGSTVIGLHLADVSAVLGSLLGWRMLIDLLLLSVCGGLYSVPLYAIVQEQSEPSHRARTIAATISSMR